MKTQLTLLLPLLALTASAQCPHDPVITPDNVILCPGEGITLSTQTADSYQWLKDGMPIPGAVGQTHAVDYQNDGGSQFAVIATVEGCAETSPSVLVDGWAFLFPYVVHTGDEPAMIGGNGESYYCPEAYVELVAGGVGANIQWTQDGAPIPGANGQSLVVTENGYYSMSGAPAVCPDFNMQLGLEIPIFFLDLANPMIVPVGDQLCFTPSAEDYQWYLNGLPITADACFTPTQGGSYTVAVDQYGCGMIHSAPFDLVLGVGEHTGRTALIAHPNPATGAFQVVSDMPLNHGWRLLDTSGRQVRTGRFQGCQSCRIDVQGIAPGEYVLLNDGAEGAAPLRVVLLSE